MTTHADISNVVLVTVDSLRSDAISPYDSDRHTPVLQELADRGTVFENAFATGNWTPFSFPGLLASRPVFADTGRIGVSESPTLAETLSEAGVETGGFNAANGFLTDHWGFDEGFDEFEPFVADVGSSLYGRYLAAHPTVEGWLQLAASPFRRLSSRLRRDGDDKPFLDTSRMLDVERAATSFVEDADEPFFLWVHYMDAHTPYVPAPRYIREVSSAMFGTHRMLLAHTRTGLGWEVGDRTLSDLRTLYQGAVRQVDASIGRLLDSLDAAGHRDETAVVVAGDHGEEFQEHGHLAHYPKLYDELIHVPLVVDVPGADARRIDGHVGLDAVPPTVCDLFDVDSPAEWDGESLVSSVVDGTDPGADPVVSVAVRGDDVTQQPIPRSLDDGDLLVSVRTREWTYVENTETGARELYHRASDPDQQTDRTVAPTPEDESVVARLREPAVEHAELLAGAGEGALDDASDDAVDDAVETRLSALGYR
ncbi:sulfatase [Haloprofundus sp. MHR1]|uniref:sulfatase n=1 Tax=Haloprofundus sp. MHR1 TaxID=2572921 RepID=UPI0010BF4B80|nr:sulfatase [Haloprofundus sp. MHR1]QCJ47444.1 sulfatase [Haloprofundus sp. MHR1]